LQIVTPTQSIKSKYKVDDSSNMKMKIKSLEVKKIKCGTHVQNGYEI